MLGEVDGRGGRRYPFCEEKYFFKRNYVISNQKDGTRVCMPFIKLYYFVHKTFFAEKRQKHHQKVPLQDIFNASVGDTRKTDLKTH